MPLRFLDWVLEIWDTSRSSRVKFFNSKNSTPLPRATKPVPPTLEYRTCYAEGVDRQQSHENDSDEEVIAVKQDVLGQ
ncbi:hypothetical protein M422DRAFT_24228 [Sphaerobolus stellatus SS14]|nr:hypothetical protein M422DRAFT_24228 [Sphaerobolus stellatus SS14]